MWLTHPDDWQEVLNEAGIEPGMIVAEVYPSRSGVMMHAVARRVGQQGGVHVVDPRFEVTSWLEGLRRSRGLPQVTIHHADPEMHVPKMPEASVDRVVIMNGLWLVQNVENYVREVRRWVKPRGEIIVVEWQPTAQSAYAPPAELRVAESDACAAFHQAECYACGRVRTPDSHWGWRFVKD